MRYLLPLLLALSVAGALGCRQTPVAPASQPAVAPSSQPASAPEVAPAPTPKVAPPTPTAPPALVGAPTLQAPPADPGVKGAWAKLRAAAKAHNYREVVAFALTILVFLWRRFAFGFVMHRLTPGQVGALTVVLAFVGTIPDALTRVPFFWGDFLWDGLVSSGEAMLLWQLVLKRIPGFQVQRAEGPATTLPTPEPKPAADAGGPP